MPMSSERWKQITPSQFPWEREALDFVRERLRERRREHCTVTRPSCPLARRLATFRRKIRVLGEN